jgi:very-short-patch-repair endonuclease
MIRNKTECPECKRLISNSNIKKHILSHSNIKKIKNFEINKNCIQENGFYLCPICSKEFTLKGISTHIWRVHIYSGQEHSKKIKYIKLGKPNFNKDKTYNELYGEEKTKNLCLSLSKIKKEYYLKNPHPIISGKQKIKISKSMKKAHAEGRAHNIGSCRWNNEPSYPEQFVIKAIKNNFKDKNYIREYSVGRYSIDFAWKEKMKAIEIDGDQHLTKKQIESDKKKDKLLISLGWELIRIRWKNLYNNPKEIIKNMDSFIGE